MRKNGFTLVEVFIVIAILAVLSSMAIGAFVILQKSTEVDNGAQEFMGVLKLAQNKTLSSEQNSQYGVYIDTNVSPNKYVLFKGVSYATRTVSYDQNSWVPKNTEFSAINLGGGNEVVFEKLTGAALQSGSVSLRHKTDTSQVKTVYISNAGIIGFADNGSLSDSARVKDSRHVHVMYNRVIATATETITLTFNGSTVQNIPITSNMSGGQIFWEGKVTVGGTDQVIKIHSQRLNNPDTEFSITRDRRYNDKSLAVTISGDTSGNIASYTADGTIVNYSSIYASNLVWQ